MKNREMNRHEIRIKAIQSLYLENYLIELQAKIAQRLEELSTNTFFDYEEGLTLENATQTYIEVLKKVKAKKEGYKLFLEFGFETTLRDESDRMQYRVLQKLPERRKAEIEKLSSLDLSKELEVENLIQDVLLMKDFDEKEFEGDVPEYLTTLVTGVLENKETLDKVIATHLSKKWSLNRIAKMDLIILRLAIYELLFQKEEVATKIVLNEAIELAKAFSDDNSSKFINGVLDSVVKDMDTSKNCF